MEKRVTVTVISRKDSLGFIIHDLQQFHLVLTCPIPGNQLLALKLKVAAVLPCVVKCSEHSPSCHLLEGSAWYLRATKTDSQTKNICDNVLVESQSLALAISWRVDVPQNVTSQEKMKQFT